MMTESAPLYIVYVCILLIVFINLLALVKNRELPLPEASFLPDRLTLAEHPGWFLMALLCNVSVASLLIAVPLMVRANPKLETLIFDLAILAILSGVPILICLVIVDALVTKELRWPKLDRWSFKRLRYEDSPVVFIVIFLLLATVGGLAVYILVPVLMSFVDERLSKYL